LLPSEKLANQEALALPRLLPFDKALLSEVEGLAANGKGFGGTHY